jgi:hypothetical protein
MNTSRGTTRVTMLGLGLTAAVALGMSSCASKREEVGVRATHEAQPDSGSPSSATINPGSDSSTDSPVFDLSLPCVGGCRDEQTKKRPGITPGPHCPSSPPELGEPCSRLGLMCSYGDDPDLMCRVDFQCAGGSWQYRVYGVVLDGHLCAPPPEGWCPPDLPEGYCSPAETGDPLCHYDDGASNLKCYCESLGLGSRVWHCFGPPADERCPAEVPQLGSGCSTPGVACHYRYPCAAGHPNSHVLCFDGQWELTSNADANCDL